MKKYKNLTPLAESKIRTAERTFESADYKVSVDPAANDRMAEHIEFLARVSENAANRLLDEMLTDIRSLESMPEACPPFNRPYLLIGRYRYKMSGKRYRIVFQIVDNYVFVDDIQDCRQSDDRNIV